jgi:hypothetical protein
MSAMPPQDHRDIEGKHHEERGGPPAQSGLLRLLPVDQPQHFQGREVHPPHEGDLLQLRLGRSRNAVDRFAAPGHLFVPDHFASPLQVKALREVYR